MIVDGKAPTTRKKNEEAQHPQDSCLKLQLTAENPAEQQLLAMLYRVTSDTNCRVYEGNRIKLFHYLKTLMPESCHLLQPAIPAKPTTSS